MAYADPPYIGQAARHYKGRADYDGEVDHVALIRELEDGFPDGWALSCSAPSLRVLLPLCPEETRVMAWVKPFASFKPGVNPAYAWEPVLVTGGRSRDRFEATVRDWVSAGITLRRGCAGAKPEGFCYWLFEVLNLRPGDEFVDMFPGSGAVAEAWEMWCRQTRLVVGGV
jgi:hypothetical protein